MKSIRIGAALALLLGAAACVPAPGQGPIFSYTPAPAPQPAPVPQAPPPPPSIDDYFGTTTGKDRIRIVSGGRSNDASKVRVCLRNSASGKNKGMHFKAGKPRYVTKRRGDVVCGEHPAGPKTVTWYFHRTLGIGAQKFVGTYQFNATGYQGQQVTFDWIDD
ncbi:MAG: hypothetical protein AAF899_18515 [Pseudomonadota bacterium]